MVIGLRDVPFCIGFKKDQILVWNLMFEFSQQRRIAIHVIMTFVNGSLHFDSVFIRLSHLLDDFSRHIVSWLPKKRNSQAQMVFEGLHESRITFTPLRPFILFCYFSNILLLRSFAFKSRDNDLSRFYFSL